MTDLQPHVALACDAQSNTGRVRENNEDSVLLWARHDIALAVVADGMGGAVAGEEASRIAVQTIYQALLPTELQPSAPAHVVDPIVVGDKLKDVIAQANRAIVRQSDLHPHLRGMGTTVTSAFVHGTRAVIGHVGDSRAYLVQGDTGHIEQITVDHSFVEAMVLAGHITRAEAEDHPMRNILYRALGQSMDMDVDLYEVALDVGDRLILCSDGLTLHVHPEEIAEASLEESGPETIAKQLILLANERGGKDNVSVVVIAVLPAENGTGEQNSKVVMRGRQHTGPWVGSGVSVADLDPEQYSGDGRDPLSSS
ncbi:MAG: Stp1/IreP family PP2C-type Ser/Thr phosphatase [Chloroflexi bacterium]|nr:Stp1/IreP family PP2C-type Ser/Thr phosphatase [Chloroflexota bacterium]